MKKIIQKLILICLCLVLSQPIFVYAKHGNPTVTAWVENDSIKFKIDGLNSDGKVTDYKILFFSKEEYNNEDYEICINFRDLNKLNSSLKDIKLVEKAGLQIWENQNDSWKILSDEITFIKRNKSNQSISCEIKNEAAAETAKDIYVLVKTDSENIILPANLAQELYGYTLDANQYKDPDGNSAKIYYVSVRDTNITLYTKAQEIVSPTSATTMVPTETPAPTETPEPTITPTSTPTLSPQPLDTATTTPEATTTSPPTKKADKKHTGAAASTETPVPSETPKPTPKPKTSVSPTPVVTDSSQGKSSGKFVLPLLILLALFVLVVVLFILKKTDKGTRKKVEPQKKTKSAPKPKAEPKKETKPQSPIKESSLEDEDTLTPFETENSGQQKKVTKPVPQKHRKFTVYSAVMNNKGRVRKNNEDNFYLNGTVMQREKMDQGAFITCICKEPVQLYAVCDGMGGNENGEDASFGAVSSLLAENKEKTKSYDKKKFTSTLQNYSDSLYRNSRRKGYKSGTTIVAASIQNEKLLLVNVGDSRIYRFRGNQLKQMTVDHSRVQKLISLGMITPEEARTHPERHVITQYLGMNADIRLSPYYVSETVQKNDIYLLCSDGLTDMVTDQQLESILTEQSNPKELVQTLVKTALHNGGRDNVTAMVLVIG